MSDTALRSVIRCRTLSDGGLSTFTRLTRGELSSLLVMTTHVTVCVLSVVDILPTAEAGGFLRSLDTCCLQVCSVGSCFIRRLRRLGRGQGASYVYSTGAKGMSCPGHDVHSSVVVAVQLGGALGACPFADIEGFGAVEDPAHGAGLGGVGRVDQNNLASGLRPFLLDQMGEHGPPGVVHRLSHPPAPFPFGTGSGQSCHVEVFDGDDLVLINQPAGEFVGAVGASVTDAGVDACDLSSLFMPVVRAFLLAGQQALGPGEFAFIPLGDLGVGDLLAGAI